MELGSVTLKINNTHHGGEGRGGGGLRGGRVTCVTCDCNCAVTVSAAAATAAGVVQEYPGLNYPI